MDCDEKIKTHIISVWMENRRWITLGGTEGMLFLTDRHMMFVHKTKAKIKWWRAVADRQITHILKTKNIMTKNDGYKETDLINDLKDERNLELQLSDIIDINHEEKIWGSVLNLVFISKKNKKTKCRFSIASDWVKYPLKDPIKYMKVDWEPFVEYIKTKIEIK